MHSTVLQTDELPGVRPQPELARDRLIALVERPWQASITTVVAGAGFGKTIFARQWAAQSTKRLGWLSVDLEDNDAGRFRARLLETVPTVAMPVRGRKDLPISLDDALKTVAASDHDLCLVIDNLHCLTDPDCLGVLNRFIAQMPENMYLMLLSRRRLPVRLGRLRTERRVRDITANDLRFTEEEAESMLGALSPSPGADSFLALWAATDGWIAGINLAVLANEFPEPARQGQPVATPTPVWDRFLDEYILEEIIDPLPAGIRDFVLHTADLPYLSPDLCDHAFVIDDSDAIIGSLVRDVPFVEPVDASGLRFRHEPFFAASLHRLARRVVPAATARQRMSRAAHWLLSQGELPSAAELAFRAGDTPLIVEVSEALGRHLADRSDLETLATWLDRIPEVVFETSLSLPYWRIMTRLGLRRTGGVGELIEAAEPRWRASGDPLHAGRASLCRGKLAFYLGDSDEADHQLRGALEQLPGDAFVERLYAATFLGKLALRQNRDDAAEILLDEAISYAAHLPLDEQWSWRVTAADRANVYALKGDLFSAITKYRFMLSELPPYLQHLEGFLRCRLVNLAIERDNLETANQEFETVVRLMQGEHRVWHHDAAIAKVRLLVASGQRDEAERWGSSYVKQLRRLPEKEQMVHQLAQIWLERGDLAMVRSWLADMGTPAYPWVNEFGDINPKALAIDLDLAQGDYVRAAVTAQGLADEAAATNRWSEYIGFAVRSAIAQHELGNEAGGIEILRPAIRRGAKGGFVRVFDVRGFNIVAMFKDLWGENREVLEVKGNLRRMQHSDLDDPSGSLTRRELEVIRLVSHGMSNQQIADSMYISVNTVRNHLVRICRRLDASSRSEAVAHARQFGILD